MTHRHCRVAGCGASASSRYSAYCSTHKGRLRRHGAIDQQGITKGNLQPFLKIVQTRIEKNLESPLWTQLDARLAALADHARSFLAYRGAMARHERIAAEELQKLTDAVPPRGLSRPHWLSSSCRNYSLAASARIVLSGHNSSDESEG
jgi:hypothetical protein